MALWVLSCLHTIDFDPAPRKDDTVYCLRCADYKQAISVAGNFRTDCDSCKVGRDYGKAFVTAETRAVSHAHRKPGHRVTVYEDAKIVREFHREVLTLNGDAAPF